MPAATASIAYSNLGQRAQPPTIARLMALMLENPKLLSLAAGFTDTHTLPESAVQAAVAALASRPSDPEHLQYGTNQGRPKLRALLAERLVAQENPDWRPRRMELDTPDFDPENVRRLERNR